ncbi:MAG: restriction endonuclease subunit S [Bacteroidales bacterium]|nr:restriction endonuclease subunit S [Bacteroidales bacterium]
MRKYDNYKDSGIEWIGQIPEHWEVVPIKYSLLMPLTDGPHETPELTPDGIPFISAEAIKNDKIDFNKKRGFISIEEHERFSLKYKPQMGDVYMIKSGATTGNLARVQTNEEFNIWSPLAAFRPAPNKTTTDFLFFFMRSSRFFSAIELGWNYGTQQNIGMNVLENLRMVRPTIQEQTAIANYLDRKTAEIDELIADKKRLLELYEEEKTAIINQAVTKGLTADEKRLNDSADTQINEISKSNKSTVQTIKMKDSGIEWLGEIPEHWDVKKLSGVCSFVRGNSSFKKDELLSKGNYVALQYGKTYKVDEVDENFKFYVNDEFFKDSQVVNYGDVIIISTSETIEDLGHSAFYNRKDLGLLGGEQMLLKPNSAMVNGKYLYYSSKNFTKELQKYATGLKVYRFNINDLKTIYISIPPIQEQENIVLHIETECALIDAKNAKTKKLIDLLTEYRTALISEVVTGKIKVI